MVREKLVSSEFTSYSSQSWRNNLVHKPTLCFDEQSQTILLRVHTTESIRKGELMIWIDVLICSIGILFAAYVIYRKHRLRPQVFGQ
ncbi:hypothetical protein D915_009567 [Fasciola hepatica]|uniref:Uncharacterized protein n=1 Tax=Fasciola hepatica TaxID=6192 RepID=A0A4E0QWD1_FASHE|nr:hypothetical protein D915_009567 [Fasciola hepatica]